MFNLKGFDIDVKKVTSFDVANLANVSQSTVSLVLNNSKKIFFSNETKERVFAAAKQLNYRLPTHGVAEQTGNRERLIMVLTPTLANQYYCELTQTIQKYADECNYRVVLCNTFRKTDLEKYYLELCVNMKVDGLILTFLPSFPQMVERMSLTTPVVLIGEKREELLIPSIELGNIRAGSILAEHLVSLGHTQFAYLSTPMSNFTLAREQRLAGFRNKLQDYGIEDNLKVMFWDGMAEHDSTRRPFEYDTGYSLAAELMKSNSKATAIIGANDMTALGIVAAVRDMGKSIPEDYSVCGFDNIFPSILPTPPLTTVEHHLAFRGKAAVDMILSRNAADSGREHKSNITADKNEFEPRLIIRSSTGKPRNDTAENN